MGGRQVKPDINYSEHQSKFRSVSQNCQAGPVEERSCKDTCCLVTFILMTLMFVGVGIYFIASIDGGDFQKVKIAMANGNSTQNSKSSNTSGAAKHFGSQIIGQNSVKSHWQQSKTNTTTELTFPNMFTALPYIALMSVFGIILSLVVVIAISKAPKVMIYGIIGFTFLVIAAGVIGGLVAGLIELTIISAIFGLVWVILVAVMFCCYKDQFEAAIVLLKVTGNFLREKPAVMLAPLFVMLISFFYFAFWLTSFLAIQLDRPAETFTTVSTSNTSSINTTSSSINSTTSQHTFDMYDLASVFWIFLNFFYSYFLYYVMVFLIATATAMWYFNINGNYLVKGLKYIWNGHIGSLTFASIIVSLISLMKSSTQNNNNRNSAAACCVCILRCCFTAIEEIIKVLNHNSIIVMSVTGESFIDSAKSAVYLIYNNFGLFIAVEMVEFLLNVCVLFLTILLPTGLGLVLLKLTYNQGPNDEVLYMMIGAIAIMVICLLISMLTITLLSEALSCVFIFYCLDDSFRKYNFGIVNRVPGELRGLFNEIQSEGQNVNAESFFRDSKQINY